MTRRPWVGGLLVICLGISACTPSPASRHFQWLLWRTPVELTVSGASAADADAAVAAIQADWGALERDWHSWQPSALRRANLAFARGELAELPDSLVRLIDQSRSLQHASAGLFDPAVGGLVELWGFHTDAYPLMTPPPSSEQLQAWLSRRPSIDDLYERDGRWGTRNPALQLDIAAVAEGAALARAAAILRQHGIDNALFNLGGDVLALGRADGRAWRVAVEDPLVGEPRAGAALPLATVELRSGEGLFVSGNYRRYRTNPSGGRWAHVLDPRTAMPVQGVAMALVISDDPVRGDAASTALLIAGPDGMGMLTHNMAIRFALLLSDEDEAWITPALDERLRWRRRPSRLSTTPPGGDG